ncbi:hypothetical protein [Papillibacter cinnamivorans]|uniref:Uncharacterized protein n=1 Tax=Papillibacter cinnamivorans DSM 12816 TaxID=1122930 RepID=A0A1W1YPL9_9FIRM|nr:hypothetical protein [Papillibacter cinnamivorans]SMC38076.1 hypothetical protein SAMN02745168_0593 [Papillibacter cinnamivorans DSM 12816]
MKIFVDPKDPHWMEKTAFGNVSNEFFNLIIRICCPIIAVSIAVNVVLRLLK